MVAYNGFWPRPLGKVFRYGITENSSKNTLMLPTFEPLTNKVILFSAMFELVLGGIGDSKRRVSLENKQSKICPFDTSLCFGKLHLHLR
jgi:hypothetical protein